MVDMPKLEDQSLNFALDILRRSHLQLGDTIFKAAFNIGSVIEQQYNGVRIAAKTKIPWGSKITLIVASGNGEQMLIPNLVGMTFKDAKAFLEESGLMLGAVIANPEVKDTANAYVYKQGQERFDADKRPRYIQAGQIMDLFLQVEMPKDSVDIKQPQ
ncbi:MAG: PASTA domain-containing protein [Ferruginibacter sp.]